MKNNDTALRLMRGFIFDMDGVIYRGDVLLPGAQAFVSRLRRTAIPFVFLTNNSTTPVTQVAERLAEMGIDAEPHDIVTSANVAAEILGREMPGRRVLVVGEQGIREALTAQGFELTDDHRVADIVVVGLDRQVTYAKLQAAALAVRRGALLVATNPDRSLPTPVGLVPGAGALVAAVEVATDVKARVIGKPSPEIFLYALARLGTPPGVTAVVGDRPDTDMIGGQRAGLRTVGVLTGAGIQAEFDAMPSPPDWVFANLEDLDRAYFDG